MKKLLISIVSASLLVAGDINVEITSIKNKIGSIYIGLYNQADSFSNIEKSFKGESVSIDGKNIKYSFKNIPNGTYALSVFHDENSNKELDKNFIGIPQEGYGFSNNTRPMLRGANFQESKFILDGNKDIEIKIGY